MFVIDTDVYIKVVKVAQGAFGSPNGRGRVEAGGEAPHMYRWKPLENEKL